MNWETIIISVIAATPATIAAAAAFIQAKKTHTAVNSRMTELLALTRQAAADDATLAEKRAEHLRKGEAAVTDAKAKEAP